MVSSQLKVEESDSTEFVDLAEKFRGELLAHCYRMLGSIHDAEDLVQETYLRAWRGYHGFEGRSSLRTWLYQIATNACLTALKGRGRRPLPSGLGSPAEHAHVSIVEDQSGLAWLQPVPDSLITPDSQDPAVIAAARESFRLALIASLQYLPARQRAVLILRDVLDWPAADVAKMLDTTIAAVKSSLQRARARMREIEASQVVITEPAEPGFQAQLYQYISAFENSDAAALEEVLCKEASLELAPVLTWFAGRATCLPFMVDRVLGEPGFWKMLPTAANGQPAVATYVRGADGQYLAYGITLLTTSETGIRRIVGFRDPTLLPTFGFPLTLAAETSLVEATD